MADTTFDVAGITIDTPSGPVVGEASNGARRFLGLPYGTARRFRTAEPPAPWTEPRDARTRGPRCPQMPRVGGGEWMNFLIDDTPQAEECLVANVFTPDAEGTGRPVMVWLHGGAFISGSGGNPAAEGSHLAARGDVVVVAINHRLNAFGYSYFEELLPGETGVNIGQTDIIRALEWVRDHAEAFGGDPSNVTIFGQSGGGGKVAALMAMPAAKGLFHRAVIQSASTLLTMATTDRATLAANLLLKELGIDKPSLAALERPSPQQILEARVRAVKANGGADNYRPVRDGRTLPADPFSPEGIAISQDIPLLIGTCEDELTFFLAATDPDFAQMDRATAVKRLMGFTDLPEPEAADFLSDVAKAYPGETTAQSLARIMTEQMYRRNDRLAADLRSGAGGAPVWNYLIRWNTAALDGHLRSPHTLCIPLAFGTTDAAQPLMGRPAEARALAERTMDAWIAFARSGDPNHKGLPTWTPYNAQTRPTMVLDDDCTLENDPQPDLREMIERCPPYSTDKGSDAARGAV